MNLIPRRRKWFACLLLFVSVWCGAADPRSLPSYHVDLSQTTVSGLSSGAFMAGQFAVAHSAIVTGAALVAGGPYYCAGYPNRGAFTPYLANALSVCMNPAEASVAAPDAAYLWERTQEFARAGLIDDVANLRRQSIFLFSGRRDRTVTTAVVDQTYNFYSYAGTQDVRYIDSVEAGHAMITANEGDNACEVTAAPYLNNCHIPLAQDILTFLYANLSAPAAQPSGRIVRFDQRRYAPPRASMASTGYAYVPASCGRNTCRVHVAFHGCRQGASAIGDRFYGHAGYNELADTNNIIVLYPQVEPSGIYPYNPRGCWDFWGYSSLDPFAPDYYTTNGAQIRAVRAMLDRLAQPRSAPET